MRMTNRSRWNRKREALWACVAGAAAAGVLAGPASGQGLEVVWQETAHPLGLADLDFSSDAALLATCGGRDGDATVRLWNASDGMPIESYTIGGSGMISVALSPDGEHLAAGYIVSGYPPGGQMQLINMTSGVVTREFGGCYVDFSPDGQFVVSGGGGANRYFQVHRVADGESVASEYTGAYIADVAYSPTGELIATAGSDNRVKLWSAPGGVLVRSLTGHTNDVSTVAFSPDGSLVASGAGGWDDSGESSIKIWRTADGVLLRTLEGAGLWVYDLAFSPDGAYLSSTGRDRANPNAYSIRFWSVSDGELEAEYAYGPYTYGVQALEYAPRGGGLAFGLGAGEVAVAYDPFACAADFNGDGRADTLDVLAFLNAWSAGDRSADFDGDGSVNTLDVLAFLNAWATGC